jgi:[Acyl-carrier-protein] S-malonyltransferase (EC 2.3.1.39)
MEESIVVETCNEISKEGFIVEPANFNSDAQIVVAGHTEAVDAFIERIKEKGGRKVVKLPVSAPFRGSSRVDLQACKLGTGRRFTTS